MRRTLVLAGALGALALAGCGSDEPPATPAACLVPASAYLSALASAPGKVLVDDSVAISDCLVEEQQPGELARVGQALIEAATELNRIALRDPTGPATGQLGYLVGAVQEGAASTGGIHEDLVRRLDAAARYSGEPGQSPGAGFERAFGAGYAAGQARG